MAFEIYNGTTSSNSQTDTNAILDKLISMWDFDSTDTTSTSHTATYGNCTITANGNSFKLTANSTDLKSATYGTPMMYSVVKSGSAVLLSFTYDTNVWWTIVVGTLTNIDGTTGKGALLVDTNSVATWYAGMGTTNQDGMYESMRTSDALTQLIPYTADRGGWYFDSAYRVIMATTTANRGLYTIGDNRYYISQRTAIKET